MKIAICLSAALMVMGCGVTSKSLSPIQVERSVLTVERIQTNSRNNEQVFFIVWKDQRGIEYVEQVKNASDTLWAKKGFSIAQLLKR